MKISKKILLGFSSLIVSLSLDTAFAAENKNSRDLAQNRRLTPKNSSPRKQTQTPGSSGPANNYLQKQYEQQLSQGLSLVRNGQFAQGANTLFTLSKRPEMAPYRSQIKFILGTALMELKLYQVAAFQFVDVIRLNSAKYKRSAIEKLSIVADILGDDTLLNYSISKVEVNQIPAQNRDMILYRLGEVKMKNQQFQDAIKFFAQVDGNSAYYNQALFNRGLSELELNQNDRAIASFQTMLQSREGQNVTDTNRVAAILATARSYYQKQDWDQSILNYSLVPRDHFMWHDALFEQTWAMLRGARFRSALSNLQSLHSAYYEDFYIPESLLLRAIVYLYICKYDEMEKVLKLFEKSYGPIRTQVTEYLRINSDPISYFNELDKVERSRKKTERPKLALPYVVVKSILEKGDIKRSFQYLRKLEDEKRRIEESSSFKNSSIGQYSTKLILNRSKNTKLIIGENVKIHLTNMRTELRDLFEQSSFIRYEMISGQKEITKKQISGSDITESLVDDNRDREFYVQNGFEYYPFKGEFWLDEIGNYHYLGKQSCE
ncbi:MAG: tetratricopeptide repeat protein [Pseudobdellovibrionaceae bacterium]